MNYPIKTCGNVCRPISVLMAAIFVNCPTYWKDVVQSRYGVLSCWLRDSTKHSSYIQKVLIAWLMQQRIDTSNLGIKDQDGLTPKRKMDPILTSAKLDREIFRCRGNRNTRGELQLQNKSEIITIFESSSDEEFSAINKKEVCR